MTSRELPAEEQLRHRAKGELRKRLRSLRSALPASACAERSARIVDALGALDVVAGGRAIALFWPMEDRHEVDLRPLDAQLRARGARVAYPAIDPETRVMTFRFVADPADLAPRGLGFREPDAQAPAAACGELTSSWFPRWPSSRRATGSGTVRASTIARYRTSPPPRSRWRWPSTSSCSPRSRTRRATSGSTCS